jgi:hypothetical protein
LGSALGTTLSSVAMATAVYSSVIAYSPAVNFQLQCMGCHLADGSGQTDRVPSVRRSLASFSTFPQGRDFVIRVPGVSQSPLSDEEVAALLNWMVKTLSDRPPTGGFREYTAEEVHQRRGRPLAQVQILRDKLLHGSSAIR